MTLSASPQLPRSFTRIGVLLLAGSMLASPFDKTPPQWPQLSTSHGPIRSGGTIKEAIQGSIDFLLTDMPMTDAELQQVRETRGVRLVHIAAAVTAVVPCYNVTGLHAPLNFSSDVLAAIFLGKIRKWNDPLILALNPSSHLPAADIIVIGHAMEDGSTLALTDFLSKTNADWQRSVGRVRSFGALTALARGQSAEDLVELVKQTPNSISYTELWAAKGQDIQIGRVKNRSGNCIDPSPASVTAAALTASPEIRDDFRASITDTKGPHDYPIASFTWIVIPNNFGDSEKRAVVISFLKWVLTEGQDAPESMHLGRLPRSVADGEIRLIDSLP
jgi:phosphate transport system substrate-binding protein